MAKINITKPTGNIEALALISAFIVEGLTYVVFDSEKVGSMGLPIIYVSKYTDKLEKIEDQNEWQTVKNYLKGIINGTSFQYVKIPEQVSANESYFTQLSLPNQTAFEAIKSRYVVKEESNEVVTPIPTITPEASVAPSINTSTPEVATPEMVVPQVAEPASGSSPSPAPMPEVVPAVVNSLPQVEAMPTMANSSVGSVDPVGVTIPEQVNPISDTSVVMSQVPPVSPISENIPDVAATPISSVEAIPVVNEMPTNVVPETPIIPAPQEEVTNANISNIDFSNDKETFLKACENMFDALITKYQKQLVDLNKREEELKNKEKEIEAKMASATEHLANAEAKEQVANIVHDNAQKVMDMNSMMPNNPTNIVTN